MKIKSLLVVALLVALAAGNLNAQVSLPLSQTFEDDDMQGWTFLDINNICDYHGISTEANHTPGLTTGRSYWVAVPEGYCYLVSPKLEDNNGVVVDFWYTNFLDGLISSFQVGYTTSGSISLDASFNPEAFHWGEDIVASQGHANDYGVGDPGWTEYNNEFPEGTTYIAIQYPSLDVIYLFVDDFTISEAACPKPSNLEVVPGANSFDLSWSGNNDSYELQYAPFQFCDFEYGNQAQFNSEWTSFSDGVSGTWLGATNEPGHGGSGKCAFSNLKGLSGNNYLVSPKVPLRGNVSFYACCEPEGSIKSESVGTQFQVLVYPGNEISEANVKDFISLESPITAVEDQYMQYSFSLDNNYASYEGYVIICHIREEEIGQYAYFYHLLIDDIAFYSNGWTSVEDISGNQYRMTALMPETHYAIQMRGVCDENSSSSWTDPLYVRTFPENTMPTSYELIHDGKWNVATNWKDWYIPQNVTDNVTISANAVIPAGCMAKGNVTISAPGGSLTIMDGGQYTGNSVNATVHKTILGCNYNTSDNTGYTLIATPMGSTVYNNSTQTNLATGDYDLYSYLPEPSDGKEWINFKYANNELNTLYANEGYLYANGSTLDMVFMGELNEDYDYSLVYDENSLLKSLRLAGNSFMHDQTFYVYDMDDQPKTANFLTMNAAGDGFETSSGHSFTAQPMQGFFVQAGGEGWKLSTEELDMASGQNVESVSLINIKASRNRGSAIDNAIVCFSDAPLMNKFYLNENVSSIYVPMNGREMAVVRSAGQGEIPVNFKAGENGNYTLSVEPENVEMNYLHLIDNMTGADIDLLAEPSYTFSAKTSDYASRFRLVFSANDNDESTSEAFAYFNGSEWSVSNMGEATLQVVDMLGRIVKSETINGNATISTANFGAGIYVMRLINGENVMTQKIVVR